MTIYYWEGVQGYDTRFAAYQGQIQRLLRGEYRSLNLEVLKGHRKPALYSIRLNKSDRLLFTTRGKSLCLLDVVLNHDYSRKY